MLSVSFAYRILIANGRLIPSFVSILYKFLRQSARFRNTEISLTRKILFYHQQCVRLKALSHLLHRVCSRAPAEDVDLIDEPAARYRLRHIPPK